MRSTLALALSTFLAGLTTAAPRCQSPTAAAFQLQPGDSICLIGNSTAERMQHHGWLEARLQARFPELGLTFRNLGFSGDALTIRQRTQGFGTPDEHLTRCKATVVIGFWGWNESFDGREGLATFRKDLSEWIDHTRSQNYSGDAAKPTRVVLCTPFPQDSSNASLTPYARAIVDAGKRADVPVVRLHSMRGFDQSAAGEPLRVHGFLATSELNARIARVIEHSLFGTAADPDPAHLEAIRTAALDKNLHWFNRYRATDGFNVYGGRSSLRYVDGVSNFDILQEELRALDVMAANRDAVIHAVARAGAAPAQLPKPDDSNVPALTPVVTNLPGPGPDGAHTFLDGVTAIAKMDVHDGLEVELFASEADFPELVNPVQMAFDPKGRLWVAAWPTYTHWRPTEPMRDALLILEDTDGDGRADKRTVFAGDLHNPTGFEFWNGGVLVAQAPDLIFLEDTDGDDRADRRTRVLHGLSSADTHHTANSFVLAPDGGLYFQEGTFHQTQIETPRGPVRNRNGCVWRYEPTTGISERYVPVNFPNPHGHVFDAWGQDIIHDGTTSRPVHGLLYSGHLDEPQEKHPWGPLAYQRRVRPCGGTEILSSTHFPPVLQDTLLVTNVIGFRGIQAHRLSYEGATITGVEIDPVLSSADENFRPVDMEVAPDGSLYFLDWHNPIIGHMQHHIRDPNRDNTHGRVYRVTCPSRPLLPVVDMTQLTPEALVAVLTDDPHDRARSRARIELSARPTAAVQAAIAAARPDVKTSLGRLELLWLSARIGPADPELREAVMADEEPRARAAVVRLLRNQRHSFRVEDVIAALDTFAADASPLVRCEVVTAASFFDAREAVAIALRAAGPAPRDVALDYVLGETLRQLDPVWREALAQDATFLADDAVGFQTLVGRLDTAALAALPRSHRVLEQLVQRPDVDHATRSTALEEMATAEGLTPIDVAIRLARDAAHPDVCAAIAQTLAGWNPADLGDHHAALAELLAEAPALARPGLRAAVLGAAKGDPATAEQLARDGKERRELLAGLEFVSASSVLAAARPWVEKQTSATIHPDGNPPGARFVRIELPREGTLTLAEVEVFAGGKNVAPEGRAKQSSTAWSGNANRAIDGKTSGRYGDNTSTHTSEGADNPWWELDLRAEVPVEQIRVWNRTDGAFGERLAGFTIELLDADRVPLWAATDQPAPTPRVRFDVDLDPSAALRSAAQRALAHIDGTAVAATQVPDVSAEEAAFRALGAEVYARDAHCVTCHQANGQGLPHLYPPLVGTRWVLEDDERLIKLVLNGLYGQIEVAGKTYRAPPMPPMTGFRDLLTDEEIAAVLTHVRSSWGNDAPPIDATTVARVRAAVKDRNLFWKPSELLELHPMK